MQNNRPRRSCLYIPGSNERALQKARSVQADTLILDLEDSVSPEAKADARQLTAAALTVDTCAGRETIVRINGLDTEWGQDDLAMVADAAVDGVLLPKVTSGSDIHSLDQALTQAGMAAGLALWVMIEMPLAILNIQEIAAASSATRLAGFVMGANDLAKEMNVTPTADRVAFISSLSQTVLAARAYGLIAIDGVYNDFRDEAGFLAECEQGRDLGFDGKSLIHPAQLQTANRVFAPDPAAVAHAEAVIAAFALPENRDKGVVSVNGKMTELLHLQQAERLLVLHERIGELEQQED